MTDDVQHIDEEVAEYAVSLSGFRTPAAILSIALPVAMMIVGLVMAVLSANAADNDDTAAIGTFGVELGAALWFAGGVTLGARPAPFRRRAILFGLLTVGGLGLIAVSFLRSWTDPQLGLAMEFGVGALAIVVIDTVLLNQVHRRLNAAAGIEKAIVTVRVAGPERGISIDAIPHDPTAPSVSDTPA